MADYCKAQVLCNKHIKKVPSLKYEKSGDEAC